MPITNSLRETVFATAYDVSLETCRRKSYLEPEKKLMLAVLEDPLRAFRSTPLRGTVRERCFSKRPSIGFKTQTVIGRFRLPTSAKP
jgi:hypothetical protein